MSLVLRFSGEAFLSVPPPLQVHLMGTHERPFLVAAPRIWNSLPLEASLATSLFSLSKWIKTFLFNQDFS